MVHHPGPVVPGSGLADLFIKSSAFTAAACPGSASCILTKQATFLSSLATALRQSSEALQIKRPNVVKQFGLILTRVRFVIGSFGGLVGTTNSLKLLMVGSRQHA